MAGRRFARKGSGGKFHFFILVLMLGVGAYAYSMYSDTKQTVESDMHKPVKAINTAVGKKKL